MKKIKKLKPEKQHPISIVVPNTTEQKMLAIVYVAEAVKELSKALNSVHLKATICNNIIENSTGAGISIGGA